jgi:predicted nucleic acid-binding protein
VGLIDADDRHHRVLRQAYERNTTAWVLPWAVLPEVDYLLSAHVGHRAEEAFVADLSSGAWRVAWGDEADLARARELCVRYRALRLGLVDAVVMATAERLRASAVATLDVRHFGAVKLRGAPRVFPRDLE